MSTTPLELRDNTFEAETRSGVTLAFFEDPWEQGCRREWKIIEHTAEVFGEDLRIGRCSVEKEPHLFERLGIRTIPTTLLLKNGREAERFVGLRHRGTLVRHLMKCMRRPS